MCKYLIILWFSLFPILAEAATYKWVDAEGSMHFTDNPNTIPQEYLTQALENSGEDITSADPEVRRSTEQGERRAMIKNAEDARQAQIEAAKKAKEEAMKPKRTFADCVGEKMARVSGNSAYGYIAALNVAKQLCAPEFGLECDYTCCHTTASNPKRLRQW